MYEKEHPAQPAVPVQRACAGGAWSFEFDGCSVPPAVALLIGAKDKDNPAGGATTAFSNSAHTGPCDNHDRCYQTCAPPIAKGFCDKQMLDEMNDVCSSSKDPPEVRRDCFKFAQIYFNGLIGFGGKAFAERQRQVCTCQPPTPPSPPVPRKITLSANTLFEFGEDRLRPTAKATLLAALGAGPRRADLSTPFLVDGHTDSKGSDTFNLELSKRRAKAVADLLEETFPNLKGHLTTQGFGESQPVEPNTNSNGTDNPEGRRKNRRVELHFSATEN